MAANRKSGLHRSDAFRRTIQTPQTAGAETAFNTGSIWKCSSTPGRLRNHLPAVDKEEERSRLTRSWKSEDNHIGKQCRIPEVIQSNIERISYIADEFENVNKSLTHIVQEEHMLLTSCAGWGGRKDCGFFSKLDRVQVLNQSAKTNIRKAHSALKDCIVVVHEFNEAMDREEENMILRAEEIEESSRNLFKKVSQRSPESDGNGEDQAAEDLAGLDFSFNDDDVFVPSNTSLNSTSKNSKKMKLKRFFF